MLTNLKQDQLIRERYKIVGLIGSGGMGAVYLADDTRLRGRQCALKETTPRPNVSEAAAQAARDQFYQEASILAQLDHPSLPKVSDFFSIDDRDYLVMDYVPGQNLLEIVNDTRRETRFLDQETVLGWADQLCDTLIYLHSRRPVVLHRDIKPANIKLTPDNRLKLVDFGLVKPLDPDDPNTLTGLQGAGSLPYAPLEQYVDHLGHTDARSDVYALGATFYHLLTNKTPASAQERFLVPESLPNPQTINPEISAGVAEAILFAMAPHPKDRPATVEQWRQYLRGSMSTSPMSNPSAGINAVNGNDWSTSLRENWWLIGVAAIMVAASLWVTFG